MNNEKNTKNEQHLKKRPSVMMALMPLAVLVTMVVGLGWMMEGVMALVESWHMPSSAWAVIYALISIVAGCIMLFSPLASTGWLILFGGCALVALGIVAIVRAFTFGKVGKSGKKR